MNSALGTISTPRAQGLCTYTLHPTVCTQRLHLVIGDPTEARPKHALIVYLVTVKTAPHCVCYLGVLRSPELELSS